MEIIAPLAAITLLGIGATIWASLYVVGLL